MLSLWLKLPLRFLPLQGFNVDQRSLLQPITAVLKSPVPSDSVVFEFCTLNGPQNRIACTHVTAHSRLNRWEPLFLSKQACLFFIHIFIMCILVFDTIYMGRKWEPDVHSRGSYFRPEYWCSYATVTVTKYLYFAVFLRISEHLAAAPSGQNHT